MYSLVLRALEPQGAVWDSYGPDQGKWEWWGWEWGHLGQQEREANHSVTLLLQGKCTFVQSHSEFWHHTEPFPGASRRLGWTHRYTHTYTWVTSVKYLWRELSEWTPHAQVEEHFLRVFLFQNMMLTVWLDVLSYKLNKLWNTSSQINDAWLITINGEER